MADEIADAVYTYAGEIQNGGNGGGGDGGDGGGGGGSGGGGGGGVFMNGSLTARRAVDVTAAVRVVEELEAATMAALMHGRTPTAHSLRRWLAELVGPALIHHVPALATSFTTSLYPRCKFICVM